MNPAPTNGRRPVTASAALLAGALAAHALSPAPARAATTGPSVAVRAVAGVYRPLHAAFADAASRLNEAVGAYCASATGAGGDPDDASGTAELGPLLDAARAAWREAVPAFGAVEPLRVGPMLEDNRVNRVFFWPDSRRAGERQLRALVADTGALDVDAMSAKSVAVQGLPALERLLYGDAARTDPVPTCRVAVPVAGNVARIAAELDAAWADPDGIGARMVEPPADDPLFRSEREVLRSLVTQLQAGLELVATAKLGPLVDADAAAMRRLPFARSALFPEYLSGNLDGLAALLLDAGLADVADVAGEAKFEVGNARRLLDQLGEDLAGNETLRGPPSETSVATARALRAGVVGIERLLIDRVAPALGTGTGFNSADGD